MNEQNNSLHQLLAEEQGDSEFLSLGSRRIILGIALATTLFHLYAAVSVVSAPVLRVMHVAMILSLCFLMFPFRRGEHRVKIPWWDWLAVLLVVVSAAYIYLGGDNLYDRATVPNQWDMCVGLIVIGAVLEAVRRTTGWIMLSVVLGFLLYALLGNLLPSPWLHRGYDLGRIVGHMVITLEGIYGAAVDVSSTLIILFTIFGAVLVETGAGSFFIRFALRIMGRSKNAAANSVVLSSFLLGSASGSGVATTVTVGSVASPLLMRAGYPKNAAGGMLSAGGLGAILCPPIMGAAAFLIAEFLKVPYLTVLKMALLPACLYYLSLFFMVAIDGRKFSIDQRSTETNTSGKELIRDCYFFFPLIGIVGMLLFGFSPILSVFWAIVIAIFSSYLGTNSRLGVRRLCLALSKGSTGVVNVAVTCAAAGIIVGVVTLTGLGLKFSSIVVGLAGGNLLFTAILTGLVVWVVGLAVPVTASYIICAVVAAPALIEVGVPDYAAHMFIFYYAVLSEVSPPTALSPFAAAAITGGDPHRTTLQCWKYTLPAFVIPFTFVLSSSGTQLLLRNIDWSIVLTLTFSILGVLSLAIGAQGWLRGEISKITRLLFIASGLSLCYPTIASNFSGLAILMCLGAYQWWVTRR